MRRPVVTPYLTAFSLCLLAAGAPAQQPGGETVDLEDSHRPDPAVHVEEGRVWFEAVLVQNAGLLEAFLCGPGGRTHESLFVATVESKALHEAISGLGLSPASLWARNERELFAIQGDKLLLWVELPDGTRRMAEDLIVHDFEGRPMRRRGWTFHARRFDEELPQEIEFSLTFKGLRSTALSMLDSPYAYRPFASFPLVGRTDVLPALEVDDQPTYPRVKIFLEPTTEEAIAQAVFEQEGAPPADDREPFLAAARRIDALKGRLRQEIRPAAATDHGDPQANELAVARLDALALEIEVAYYDLDLLHQRREKGAYEARADADSRIVAYQDWAIDVYEVYRESAREEHRAAAAGVEALGMKIAGEPESAWRRHELIREASLARVKSLNLRPQVKDVRDQLEAATSDFAREHFGRLLQVLESHVHIADCEALRAELRREMLDVEGERAAELEEQIVGLEGEMETAGRIVEVYDLEERMSKLRRDLNFYKAPGIGDAEKVVEIEREMSEVQARLERLRASVDEDE